MENRSDSVVQAAGRSRGWLTPLIAALLLGAGLLVSVAMGPADVPVTPMQAVRVVAYHALGRGPEPPLEVDAIVWQVRLPRALCGAMVGMLLGAAGVALQGLLMNPLADPYTVGVSAGAAVGAATAEVLGFGGILMGLGAVAPAFAAALGAVALVYALARVNGRVAVHTFLLAGVVVGTLLWSLIPLLMVLGHRGDDLQRIYFYLVGNLQSTDWLRASLLTPFCVICWALLRLWAAELNLMALGEETAHHLGVDTERFKRKVLLVGSLATAAAVSVSGIIGFVGLVVPHIARRLTGPDHGRLLPVAAMLGAGLVLASDTLVRVWLNDLPVGIVTSIVGAPIFCLLLRARRGVAW